MGGRSRLSWLSPRIVEVIAKGEQPRTLTRKILLTSDLPVDWSEQEKHFGIAD